MKVARRLLKQSDILDIWLPLHESILYMHRTAFDYPKLPLVAKEFFNCSELPTVLISANAIKFILSDEIVSNTNRDQT